MYLNRQSFHCLLVKKNGNQSLYIFFPDSIEHEDSNVLLPVVDKELQVLADVISDVSGLLLPLSVVAEDEDSTDHGKSEVLLPRGTDEADRKADLPKARNKERSGLLSVSSTNLLNAGKKQDREEALGSRDLLDISKKPGRGSLKLLAKKTFSVELLKHLVEAIQNLLTM